MKRYVLMILILLTFNSCLYRNINSFEKYCDYVHNMPKTLILGWDKEKIKEDFVSFYNQNLLTYIGKLNLDGASSQDSVVQFMYKNGLIGVTQIEDELYIRNCFLYSESDSTLQEINVPKEDTFKGFTEHFEYLFKNRIELKDEMSVDQYGMFAAMKAFYKKIIIQGPKDETFEIINDRF